MTSIVDDDLKRSVELHDLSDYTWISLMTLVDCERQLFWFDVESYDPGIRKPFLPCREGLTKTNANFQHFKNITMANKMPQMPLVMRRVVVHVDLVGPMITEDFIKRHEMISGCGIGTMNLPPHFLM